MDTSLGSSSGSGGANGGGDAGEMIQIAAFVNNVDPSAGYWVHTRGGITRMVSLYTTRAREEEKEREGEREG